MNYKMTRLLAATAAAATMAAPAYAQNVGAIATGLTGQLQSIGSMAMIVAAVLGVGIAIMGLLKFKAHSANPNDPSNKLSSAFVLVFVGAAMIAVPALLGTGVSTIFGGSTGTIDNNFVKVP